MIYVGTAGWSVPKAAGHRFPGPGSHLERYARVLRCAEINSTFKRVHREATYARWAASTPSDFRFSVKLPRAITHEQRLVNVDSALAAFLGDVEWLGIRLGPVPGAFFAALRQRYARGVVCEPRHPGWFSPHADQLMEQFRIARVAADPARIAAAERPGGWRGDAQGGGLSYFRWHGAPQVYRSAYGSERLGELARQVTSSARGGDCWCMFDNTAAGAAAQNALDLLELLGGGRVRGERTKSPSNIG